MCDRAHGCTYSRIIKSLDTAIKQEYGDCRKASLQAPLEASWEWGWAIPLWTWGSKGLTTAVTLAARGMASSSSAWDSRVNYSDFDLFRLQVKLWIRCLPFVYGFAPQKNKYLSLLWHINRYFSDGTGDHSTSSVVQEAPILKRKLQSSLIRGDWKNENETQLSWATYHTLEQTLAWLPAMHGTAETRCRFRNRRKTSKYCSFCLEFPERDLAQMGRYKDVSLPSCPPHFNDDNSNDSIMKLRTECFTTGKKTPRKTLRPR